MGETVAVIFTVFTPVSPWVITFKNQCFAKRGTKMSLKRATPVEIIDGNSFRLRTDAIIVLEGVEAPDKTTPEGAKCKEKLAELVLKKKVEYETTEWTPMGQTKANVTQEGVNINEVMKEFIAGL